MKNEKFIYIFGLIFLLFFPPRAIFAESSYVLPYPSSMPGSAFYRLHVFYEHASKYWYFGDFGQFDYNRKLSDKYLVEAKTLFEYKQYLLGYKALKKSDSYFVDIEPNLINAKKRDKDIHQKENILQEASLRHIETLEDLKESLPRFFVWRPEKEEQTSLDLEKDLNESIRLREMNL